MQLFISVFVRIEEETLPNGNKNQPSLKPSRLEVPKKQPMECQFMQMTCNYCI